MPKSNFSLKQQDNNNSQLFLLELQRRVNVLAVGE